MRHSLASRYGSCRDISDELLQPGDYWRYPRWFIDFLKRRSPREKELNSVARAFLEALLDGEWHRETPRIVGVGTIEACVDLKLAEVRLIPKEGEPGVSHGEFKITDEGKQVLERNCLLPPSVN
jgi:hypothetical protein